MIICPFALFALLPHLALSFYLSSSTQDPCLAVFNVLHLFLLTLVRRNNIKDYALFVLSVSAFSYFLSFLLSHFLSLLTLLSLFSNARFPILFVHCAQGVVVCLTDYFLGIVTGLVNTGNKKKGNLKRNKKGSARSSVAPWHQPTVCDTVSYFVCCVLICKGLERLVCAVSCKYVSNRMEGSIFLSGFYLILTL